MKGTRQSVSLLRRLFKYRFILAKVTHVPIIGKIIDKMLFENDDLIYLPRDRVIDKDVDIQRPEELILPSQVVNHFIEKAGHHWIMDTCICRESTDCSEHPKDIGCLFLGEAPQGIDTGLGCSVTKQEAFDHVKRARKAGLVHLIGRNKLDPVWLDVKPEEKFLTICNCCPCCCLWRMIPDLAPDISQKIHSLPGIEINVNDDCIGCGRCAEVCFVNAMKIQDGKARVHEDCRGCSRCVDICGQNAIEIKMDRSKLRQAISDIESSVDIT